MNKAWWKTSFCTFNTPEERGGTILAWAIVSLFAFVPAKIWWEKAQTYVSLVEPNKAVLFEGGWFFNPKQHELHIYRGQWYLDNGDELMVPIEGPYNDHFVIRFEDHGRVYRINKSEKTQTQLRVVDGEWSELCDDGAWASIYDDHFLYESSNESSPEY
jgi:hypothetical protein